MLKDLGVKLACVGVAIVLWVQVASRVQVEETVALPLRFDNVPDSLLVRTGSAPERIRVRMRTSRLQRLADDLVPGDAGEVIVSLAGATPPAFRERIALDDVRSKGEAVTVLSPLLELGIHRRVRRLLPVRVAVEDQLPTGYTLVEAPVLTPAEVEVTGPQGFVNGLTHINTAPISVKGKRKSFRETVPLDSPDVDLELRPIEVEATFAIDEFVERGFPGVPLSILSDVDSTRVYVEPTTAQVRITGPARLVAALTLEDVSLVLAVGEKAPGVYQLQPEVVLPERVRSAGVDPPSFQVIVERAEETEEGGNP